MTRWLGLIAVAFFLSGCATAGIAVDALLGGVGIYQRYEDRQAQKDQTEEIKKLRETIETLMKQMKDARSP